MISIRNNRKCIKEPQINCILVKLMIEYIMNIDKSIYRKIIININTIIVH